MKSDRSPIPPIHDIMSIEGGVIFSALDLVLTYITITPLGLFEFTRMTFQPFMNEVLRGLNFARRYIDDVIIFSKNENEHKEHLGAVLAGLKITG